MDMGITKGVEVYVRKVAPLGDPIELNVRGYELTLRKEDDVTSASPVTNKTLKRFEQTVELLLEKTDVFLQFFDKQCGNRFHWEIRKLAMQVGREQPTHVSFEDFINEQNEG